jgi:hypothetical protein
VRSSNAAKIGLSLVGTIHPLGVKIDFQNAKKKTKKNHLIFLNFLVKNFFVK